MNSEMESEMKNKTGERKNRKTQKDMNVKIEELIRKIAKSLKFYTKNHLKCYDLTVPRFYVLFVIFKFQPVNMSKIHQELHMANSTVTVIVDYLYEKNLVKRYRDPEDRRVVLLEITEAGKEIMDKLMQIRQNLMRELLEDIDDDKQEELMLLLQKIYNKIEIMDLAGDK